MSEIQRYMEALRNADAAGDTQAAAQLASRIRQMQEQQASPPPSVTEPPSAPPPQDPSAGGGTLQFGPFDTGIEIPQGGNRFLAGIGKSFTDLGRGAEQLVRERIPGVSEREAALNSEIEASRARDAPLMDTGAGLAGNIVGNVAAAAPAMGIPGVNTYMGSAALGGALSALQPVTEGESRLANAGMGAAGGMGGRAIGGGVSRLLAPKTAPAASQALSEGIPLTPGQILGPTANRIEQGFTSVPVVGDFIKQGRRRAIEGFNKAALNRVLKPIGEKAAKIGREGVEEAYEKVSGAYSALLPKLKVAVDKKFTNEIRNVLSMADNLPPASKDQLQNIIKSQVATKFSPNGRMPGEVMKQVDSELGRIARGYMRSEQFSERELGTAVREVQRVLREMVKRSNPSMSKDLTNIDQAYSRLLRVENAAARIGSKEGVFSPAQLRAASRQMDPTLRKRGFAQGKASFQDFAEQGEGLLGQTVPDSGTPYRLANILMTGGGYAIDPTLALGVGASAGAYSNMGQRGLAAALTKRPDVVRQAGRALSDRAALAAALGATASTRYANAQK